MSKVLLIDDDQKLAPLLTEYCVRYGIQISAAQLPSIGLTMLQEESFAAVILDVMMPEMDGFEVCRKIRQFSDIPIIMLTARGEVTDRVVGIELGADDYLPKPFEPRELVARLNSIIKRKGVGVAINERVANLEYQQLTIKCEQREVWVNKRQVELTTMEYQLLLLLANSPGKDFSRDAILNQLKGIDTELFSRSVDILVSRLRTKLKPATPIKTVYGSGYAFVLAKL
ncbi:MAG: response regulator with CheY-like receiver domain and winged-helix DNA-binding domain protein [Osedax symbiont Rs1]|nr:MAG: response regulator with CheY-like receiver domain and winged-helix DNA-binding domain protein [Osedax symbiont Rs1]